MVALAVVAVAASGCAKAVAGSAVPNADAAKEASSPLTAQQALGDYASVNYCGLLDTTPLPDNLGSLIRAPKPAFEYCAFAVRESGIEVDVRVGYLDDSVTMAGADHTEDRSKTPPRALKVERSTESGAACVRYLRFVDDMWLTIQAIAASGKGDWCRIADATVDEVIRRLVAKQVKHFSFSEKSLGKIDACDLVPASTVGAKVGMANGTAMRFPAHHACYWTGSKKTDPIARLFFGKAATSYDIDHTKEETLADHTSYVTPLAPDADYSYCSVETNHIDSPDLGTKELALIEVELGGKGNDACTPARELAKEVWAKLPKP
jgi:hypothetical protein